MKNMTLVDFANQVASNSPVPGGGSIAAVCGTLSAALTEMVANLTIGKKKYMQVEEHMKEIIQEACNLRNKLIDDIQKDSDSYNKVMTSYKMPKDTDEEKVIRQKNIQESLKNAALVPLSVAESSYQVLPLVEEVIEKGNSNAVTDGLVACMMARTSVLSALLNVKINLISINDIDFVNNLNGKVKELEIRTMEYEKKILEKSPF
ncbi:MAG: cyclodeaminase/cyclohydrolase family protein [Tissierellia bacterium]|nr:cyclodeaminase/cyclohydrolase family protein [Tissierellia bacterium]